MNTRESFTSEAEVRHFVDEGYLVIENLLTPDEIAALRAEALALCRQEQVKLGRQPGPSAADAMDGVLALHRAHYESDVFCGAVLHEGICGWLGKLASAHLAYPTGNVKNVYSILFVKPPGLPGQAWHQDETYVPSRDRSLIAAWLALEDATLENGCLQVIPRSHRHGYMYPSREHGRPEEFDENLEAYGFDESTAVALEIKAGTVIFMNGYLLHMSKANRSQRSRLSLVSHYVSSETLLPWTNTADGGTVAMADNRRVLHAAGVDPYAWKGYEALTGGVYARGFTPKKTT